MFFKPNLDRRSLEVRNLEIENENFIVKEVSVSHIFMRNQHIVRK